MANTRRFSLQLAALVLMLAALAALPPKAQAELQVDPPAKARYLLDVTVDVSSGALAARETVRFSNPSDEPLNEIIFNVTPARLGAFALDSATIDGRPATGNLDGVVLALPLRSPLQPGDSVEVALDFRERVPSPGDLRFGRLKGALALGNWFPQLAVYRPGQGWDRHQYVDTGDAFVTSVADFDLTLSVTGGENLVVAHPGTKIAQNGNQWRIRSENARDFALAIDSGYRTASAEVDGTTIRTYYLPEHAAGGAVYLRAAVDSFRWYNRVLGQYPYQSLTIVESTGNDPGWVGQEYPGIILIGGSTTASGGTMGDYLTYAIAHEVAHQWFYALVGNNQVYEPWLDEAFATFLSYQYLRLYYPDSYAWRWAGQKERYHAASTTYGRRDVNSSIYDFEVENHYYAMIYSQGALFLDDLRQTLGDESFWQLMRGFVARYRNQIATGRSFLAMANQMAGRDLGDLYARYFSPDLYASALDWAVPNGHFYSQANGWPIGEVTSGYSVTNEDGVPFWDEFRRLGGPAGVGYPASRRFVWDGFVSQVFQKGVFQWHPEAGQAYLVNVFDQMSLQGKDDWLRAVRSAPKIADWAGDAGLAWSAIVDTHQRLLDANAAIKAQYFAAANPVTFYGLPMAPVTDVGDAFVLRAQRAIIQQWKVDVPWARAGQVTVANGGDIAKEAGLVPQAALRVESPE